MERVSDEWLSEMVKLYSVICTSEGNIQLYRALYELRLRRDVDGAIGMAGVVDEWLDDVLSSVDGSELVRRSYVSVKEALIELQARRKAEKEHGYTSHGTNGKEGAGATQEREKAINEFWKKIAINYLNRPCSECPATSGDDDCGHWGGTCGHSLRKKYESIAGIPQKNAKEAVLPTPVKQVDGVDVKTWTIKKWFQKINEELDELKEAVGSPLIATPRELYSVTWSDFSDRAIEERCKKIAEEAADTITAITSMLEAMGIDEQQRQAAQSRVNNNNRQRGRM